MTVRNSEYHESNNLYIMIFAIVIAFMLIFSIILGLSAISGATFLSDDGGTGPPEQTRADDNVLKLQLLASDDGSWDNAKTTSIAVLALNIAGVQPDDTWENSNGVTVSIGNEQYPNSLSWMVSYLEEPEWAQSPASIDVESFSLVILAYHSTGTPTDNIGDAITILENARNTESGSWNNDVHDTAMASYVLAKVKSPQEPAVVEGVSYLKEQEQDLYFASVLDSSTAILALYVTDDDVSGELKTLTGHQDKSGSFGTIEDTTWAILALSIDETGNTYSAGTDAQVWLSSQDADSAVKMDLGYIVLGTTVAFGSVEDAQAPDEPDEVVDGTNTTLDGNESFTPSASDDSDAGQEKNLDPFEPPTDSDHLGDTGEIDGPSDNADGSESTFANNSLWTIIAIITVVIIMSLATWGLIARVEEGRALEGVRRDILEYIKHNPGEHFAGIMHEFDMSPSSTTYHLKVLEETENVVAHKDNKYKRFYASSNTLQLETRTKDYKELLSALKNITARKIVWYVLDHPGVNQKELASELGIHPSTVNWHATRLYQAGVMKKLKTGKEVSYTIPNEDSVRSGMTIIEERT